MDLLIQAIIGLLAGFVGGLLGIGGSLIIIPSFIFYLSHTAGGYTGQTQHLLQAAAMICNVFVSIPAMIVHYRAKTIMPGVVRRLIPGALAGTLLGVALTNSHWFARDNGRYLAVGLALFLAYETGYNLWRLLVHGGTDHSDEPRDVPGWQATGVGLATGLVAGLLGIGGGLLAVPAQQVFLPLPLRRAIANSTTTIIFTAALGAAFKNATLPVHGLTVLASLKLAAMLIPTALLGSLLGGRLMYRLPRRALRVAFIIFMTFATWQTFRKALAAPATPASTVSVMAPR
jgi:uncharacterized protein